MSESLVTRDPTVDRRGQKTSPRFWEYFIFFSVFDPNKKWRSQFFFASFSAKLSRVKRGWWRIGILLGQTERLPAWVFCGFWGLILVDSSGNWFYDFASSAGEMELPKSPAAGAIGFRCQRTAVTSTDTAEFVSSTPRTSQNGSSIMGRAIPAKGRSQLKSLCLDEMMPARW